MAKAYNMNAQAEVRMIRMAKEEGWELPDGYSIDQRGNVTRGAVSDEDLSYKIRLMELAYQQWQLEVLMSIKSWVTVFGVLTIIGLVIGLIF